MCKRDEEANNFFSLFYLLTLSYFVGQLDCYYHLPLCHSLELREFIVHLRKCSIEFVQYKSATPQQLNSNSTADYII
jgi:hypothetical protein